MSNYKIDTITEIDIDKILDIYNFKENHANKVRIDVVYNYDHNAVDFWKKQGFIPCEKIQLEWNGYKTNAIKMLKFI